MDHGQRVRARATLWPPKPNDVLTAAPPAGSGYQLGMPTQATVMVRDDDQVRQVLEQALVAE